MARIASSLPAFTSAVVSAATVLARRLSVLASVASHSDPQEYHAFASGAFRHFPSLSWAPRCNHSALVFPWLRAPRCPLHVQRHRASLAHLCRLPLRTLLASRPVAAASSFRTRACSSRATIAIWAGLRVPAKLRRVFSGFSASRSSRRRASRAAFSALRAARSVLLDVAEGHSTSRLRASAPATSK